MEITNCEIILCSKITKDREGEKHSSALSTSMYLPTFDLIAWVTNKSDTLTCLLIWRATQRPNISLSPFPCVAHFCLCWRGFAGFAQFVRKMKWNPEINISHEFNQCHTILFYYTIQSNLTNAYAKRFPTGTALCVELDHICIDICM